MSFGSCRLVNKGEVCREPLLLLHKICDPKTIISIRIGRMQHLIIGT